MGEKGAIVDAFVDRTEELAALEEQFADHQAAMVVIYGRRRIGKTALITEFVRDKRALYFLATEESEEQNREMCIRDSRRAPTTCTRRVMRPTRSPSPRASQRRGS